MTEGLPFAFTSGWASGINAYATVLVMGLLGRFAGVDAVPEGLQSNEVLGAAAVMFAIELVADKVPWVDSVWDAVQTPVRPAIGATIGILIAGDAQGLSEPAGGGVGGVTALLSHMVKAGIRLLINLSPEPFSNIIVSAVEDFSVGAMVSLALATPWLAAIVAAVFLWMGLVVLWFSYRAIQRLRNMRSPRPASGGGMT